MRLNAQGITAEVQMNRKLAVAALAATFLVTAAFGHATYTGYSGAPGTLGQCASSCHGSTGGTITVTGFPTAYTPGQTYVVNVVHRSGSSIENFNGSIRVGSGSTNAGTIAAGYRTATYNTGGETNGIHLSSNGRDSCTFAWTAPTPGVGTVTLYIAGHQGTSINGANTTLTRTATQAAGIEEQPFAGRGLRVSVTPTLVTGSTAIRLSLRAGVQPLVRVLDRTGRIVARINVPASTGSSTTVNWQPVRADGRRLPAGSYLLVVTADGARITRKLTVR